MAKQQHPSTAKREAIKTEHWDKEEGWTGMNEKGWFKAPRTLPHLLKLLASKELSGNKDPSSTYIELLSRHIDSGIVEMGSEADHAYCAGYMGPRAIRTWQERMKILEDIGFIKTKKIGNQQYRYVLLVHPTKIVEQLAKAKKVSPAWLEAYRDRALETKEIKAA